MATWEPEDSDVPDFKGAVEYYDNLRFVVMKSFTLFEELREFHGSV